MILQNLPRPPHHAHALAVLLAAALLAGGCGSHPKPVIKLGGPGHATVPKPPVQDVTRADAGLEDHRGARDELPDGMSRRVLRIQQAGLAALAEHDQLPITAPDAAPTFRGCTSRFVRNYSSRRGIAPHELVAHYTVSHNTPGWNDVWAVVSLFDRAAYQASSHFVIDAEGHCAYIVRDTDKAWTQAAANSYSVSIEFIAYGDERELSPAALKRAGEVFATEARRWQIPIQLGQVTNCLPTRPGIVDHAMLGACGGGHHDLVPFYGTPLATTASGAIPSNDLNARRLAPLINATRRAAGAPTTDLAAAAKTACRKLTWHRHQADASRRAGARSWWANRRHVARARELKRAIARGRIACPAP